MNLSGRRRRWLAGALALMVIAPLGGTADAGATGGVAPVAEDEGTTGETTPWTILVYFAADTNIETSALIDLEELAQAAGPNVQIVAFMDRSPDYQPIGDPSLDFFVDDAGVLDLPDFHDSKVFEVTAEGTEVVWDEGELNSAHPQTLAWFLWYGLTNYPSEKTAAVMWDHGGGALYTFGDDIVVDGADVTQEYFSIPELQQAFQSALAAAGREKFDLLVFDTCLDAAFEVARGMAPFADKLLASEEIMAGHGQDYTAFGRLNDDGPAADGQTLGQQVFDSFEAHIEASPLFASPSDYTLSLIDLEQMAAVDTALTGFVDALETDLATNGPALLQARSAALEYGYPGPDASINPNMVDLGDLLGRLPDSMDPAVLNARNAVSAALDSAVIASINGPDAAAASGLSIYLPPNGAAYNEEYDEITDPTGWGTMLEELLTTAAADPEVSGEGLDLQSDSDGWLASLTVDDASALAAAGGLFGTPRDDGTMRLLAALPATIGAGEVNQIQASWSYELLRLDGQPVTMAVEQGAQGLRASVPGVYFSPTGDQREAVLRFPLEVDGGAITGIGDPSLLDAAGGSAPIPVSADSQFVPLVQILDGAEFVETVQLDPIDPTDFEVSVGEIETGGRFTAAVYVVNPDGSVTARSAIDNRP